MNENLTTRQAKALQKNFTDRKGTTETSKVLRFWNNEVLANTEGVLEVIRDCLNHPPLTPLPSREGKLWMVST